MPEAFFYISEMAAQIGKSVCMEQTPKPQKRICGKHIYLGGKPFETGGYIPLYRREMWDNIKMEV